MHHQVAVPTILELCTLFIYLIRKKVLVLKSRGKFSRMVFGLSAGNNNSIKCTTKQALLALAVLTVVERRVVERRVEDG